MPEGVGYSGSNVVATTGLELNYVGNHCYAYSGVITTAGSQSAATDTSLSFTSGKFYSKVKLTWSNDLGSATANEFYLVKLNEQIVYQAEQEHNIDTVTNPTVIHLIIPPLTEVRLTADNQGSSNSRDQCVSITGRVYNA